MNGGLVLAIDQGTTNTKALVVGADGLVRTLHTERVGIEFPRPGWAQSDALEIWRSVERVVRACLDDLLRSDAKVVAVAVANQRESVVAWDRASGEPLGPLVSWQCNRGAELCARLTAPGSTALVSARTGLTLDPMFSASKMRWLLDEIPDGRERAAAGELCLGTVDSWLLSKLSTGTFATDCTNASRTLLFDIDALDWSSELLSLFDLPRAALPVIRPSADAFGPCTIAHRGLDDGAIVGSLIGDSHAALIGHGAFFPGAVKASFGTGTSVMAPVDAVLRSARLSSTIAWSRRDRQGATMAVPAIEGNVYASGSALEWVAELVGLHGDVGRLETLALSTPDSGGVVFVPALAGLGAPHWDPDARGTITGLTRHAGPAEIARAAFDSVGHQVADVVDEIEQALGRAPDALHVDGGAMRSGLLASTVADLVGLPLRLSDEPELAALGAAGLAGLAAGVWPDVDALQALPRNVRTIEPTGDEGMRAEQRAAWASSVERTLSRVR